MIILNREEILGILIKERGIVSMISDIIVKLVNI